jgi:myo-inositol-1-phosphate synthase
MNANTRSHVLVIGEVAERPTLTLLNVARTQGESMLMTNPGRRLGVAVVGLGGAVATTAVAGIEILRRGANRREGLPLADVNVPGLADYRDMVFGGWDLNGTDLATAATGHRVLNDAQMASTGEALSAIRPWPAVGSGAFCRGVDGANKHEAPGHRAAVQAIAEDLRRFRDSSGADAGGRGNAWFARRLRAGAGPR